MIFLPIHLDASGVTRDLDEKSSNLKSAPKSARAAFGSGNNILANNLLALLTLIL